MTEDFKACSWGPAPNSGSPGTSPLDVRRRAIAEAYRVPEPVCVPPLIEEARVDPDMAAKIASLAGNLVSKVRGERAHTFGVEALMQEFSLSSREGIALMCLAESLLRIPDRPTRDLLIRDKLARGDWSSHLGKSPSWVVNASAWSLLMTGKLVATHSEPGMTAALTRAVARGGEPVIRAAMDLAMRLLGRQFVTGRTIEEALNHARPYEERGFLYSFDMLGEAAVTAADATRYMAAYEHAIRKIGGGKRAGSVYERAGISVKLSALHPRYSFAQMDRVWDELYPRLRHLALLACEQGIGFNIDAEEADRLEPSLDLLEALSREESLKGWQGLGFVVQAYQKRAPSVIDYLQSLAEATGRRLMVRLVKGAYWDSEIKRAQVEGLSGYPVYTRKAYTDVCYLACAKRLLARRDLLFPQFATHNAHTLAAIYHLAGSHFSRGDYEFQCLHGMGETPYGHVVGAANLDRPCRIYAPVGTHETLLPYLVRRLLENGANSSFVRQLADEQIPISGLIADPVAKASASNGAPHPMIVLPENLFGAERKNSDGLDLSDACTRDDILHSIEETRSIKFRTGPILASRPNGSDVQSPVLNPADRTDIVGYAANSTPACVDAALAAAEGVAPEWAAIAAPERAKLLDRAADLIEEAEERLCSFIVREAGRTIPDALAEVREAVDFCRYYAAEARKLGPACSPLGPIVCISPWNFPLAIFTGQIAASLAAGNPVLAKPAEQTPLIAAEVVGLLHEAGIPRAALQLLPGPGAEIGQALVAERRTKAVVFTGSTETARLIQRTLAARGNIPFIAETGGQNAVIVDSSALPEQAVGDILTSAFNSAGQRCSSLRILCLQEDIAAPVLEMLKGAMSELRIGDPARYETDIGPVIDEEAKRALTAYVEARRDSILFETPRPASSKTGTFVPPVLLEIKSIKELTREVFGPVLHVIRFARNRLPKLLDDINGTRYGLTLGIHSRIDETIEMIADRAHAGNVYVNRNMIGAVVGVQPFGGEGLSGTGPKAGGPLYLYRLLEHAPPPRFEGTRQQSRLDRFEVLAHWVAGRAGSLLDQDQLKELAALFELYRKTSPLLIEMDLPSPVGESNRLLFRPRGAVLGMPESSFDALHQLGAALATGNRLILANAEQRGSIGGFLPRELAGVIAFTADWQSAQFDAVLVSGAEAATDIAKAVAEKDGPIIPVICGQPEFPLFRLVKEKTITINTAAAGGNASLMTIGG